MRHLTVTVLDRRPPDKAGRLLRVPQGLQGGAVGGGLAVVVRRDVDVVLAHAVLLSDAKSLARYYARYYADTC